jgi:hypothetical protein
LAWTDADGKTGYGTSDNIISNQATVVMPRKAKKGAEQKAMCTVISISEQRTIR